jgi:hypothetical protein
MNLELFYQSEQFKQKKFSPMPKIQKEVDPSFFKQQSCDQLRFQTVYSKSKTERELYSSSNEKK